MAIGIAFTVLGLLVSHVLVFWLAKKANTWCPKCGGPLPSHQPLTPPTPPAHSTLRARNAYRL